MRGAMSRGGVTGQVWGAAKFVKLLPLLTVVALLAGVPAAVSGQTMPTVRITQTTIDVTEGTDSEAQVTVEISPAPSFVADVTISTMEGTAEAPEDFEQLTQAIQFSSTVTSQTVSVEIKDDLIYEPPENIFVNLSSSDPRIDVVNTGTEIRIENDEVIELALGSEMIIVQEGSTAQQLCVVRSDSGSVIIGSGISFDMHIRFTDPGGALVSGQDNPASVGIAAGSTQWCVDFNTQDVDDTTDVNFELRRTPLHPRDVRLSDRRYTTVRVVDTPDCATNGAVTDPTNLVADCNALLMAKEYLRGTATLNWSDSLAIGSWEGVTLSETPLRVTELNLGGKGLNGTLPSELGELVRLRKLRLTGNSLISGIPTELNSLVRIDEFHLNSNRLSGEIPDLRNLGSSLGTTAIIYFRLGNNELTGDIEDVQLPTERMKELDLSNNSLTGDPSVFLVSIQNSIQYGSLGLTGIRLAGNNFNTCIPLYLVEVLDDRARRLLGEDDVLDPLAGLDHDFANMTCPLVPFVRRPAQDFNALVGAENTNPWGIWSDGETMWVSDEGDDKIYAYDLDTKARYSVKDFDSLGVAGNTSPAGIWSDGTTMWVVNRTGGYLCVVGHDCPTYVKIYAYGLASEDREGEKDFDTLNPPGNRGPNRAPQGIWSDGATMWVGDFIEDSINAYSLETTRREEERDFDTLGPADNSRGIWSDRKTMWVANWSDKKIYAYSLVTKRRDEGRDFDTLVTAGNSSPRGIWSDGETMWVVDSGEDKIYAYYMPTGLSRPVTDSNRITARPVIDPGDVDPARPSVIKPDLCVADIVDPDGGEIELGDTIADSWVGGCPSVTRGGRLAKYYTFNLPITTAAEIAFDSHLDDYLVLRSGGLSGSVVEQDDDDGPGNNSLISGTLKAGEVHHRGHHLLRRRRGGGVHPLGQGRPPHPVRWPRGRHSPRRLHRRRAHHDRQAVAHPAHGHAGNHHRGRRRLRRGHRPARRRPSLGRQRRHRGSGPPQDSLGAVRRHNRRDPRVRELVGPHAGGRAGDTDPTRRRARPEPGPPRPGSPHRQGRGRPAATAVSRRAFIIRHRHVLRRTRRVCLGHHLPKEPRQLRRPGDRPLADRGRGHHRSPHIRPGDPRRHRLPVPGRQLQSQRQRTSAGPAPRPPGHRR